MTKQLGSQVAVSAVPAKIVVKLQWIICSIPSVLLFESFLALCT